MAYFDFRDALERHAVDRKDFITPKELSRLGENRFWKFNLRNLSERWSIWMQSCQTVQYLPSLMHWIAEEKVLFTLANLWTVCFRLINAANLGNPVRGRMKSQLDESEKRPVEVQHIARLSLRWHSSTIAVTCSKK